MAGPGLIWADDLDEPDEFDEDDEDDDDGHLIDMFGDHDSSDDDDINIMGLDVNPVCVIQ